MLRLFHRLLALGLAACLITNDVSGSGFRVQGSTRNLKHETWNVLFAAQALAERPGWVGALTWQKISSTIQNWPGQYVLRRAATGGAQKPYGSQLTPQEMRDLLVKNTSRPIDKSLVARALAVTPPTSQANDPLFQAAFPRFRDELELAKRILESENIQAVLPELSAFYGERARRDPWVLSLKELEFRFIKTDHLDPTTNSPVQAGAFWEPGHKLVICLTPGNGVGAFHEIYEHLILPFNPDIPEADRHTAAALVDTAFSHKGLITERAEDQLKIMLRANEEPLKRLLREYLQVIEEIWAGKFRHQPAMRNYALVHAQALHTYWDDAWANHEIKKFLRRERDDLGDLMRFGERDEKTLVRLMKEDLNLMSGQECVHLVRMVGNPLWIEHPDQETGEVSEKEIKKFISYVDDDAVAAQSLDKFKASGDEALKTKIDIRQVAYGEGSALLILLELAEDRLLESGHASKYVVNAGKSLRTYIENGRDQKAKSIPQDMDDETFRKLMLENFNGISTSQSIKDDERWIWCSVYLAKFKAFNQLFKDAPLELRYAVLEWPDLYDLENRATLVSNEPALTPLPTESMSWPANHRRLWQLAALLDPATRELIQSFEQEHDKEGLHFLVNEGSPLAVLLSANEPREAAQAFLRNYDPVPMDNTIFKQGDDLQKAFFWYYLDPVFQALRSRGFNRDEAGRRLAQWARSPGEQRLWKSSIKNSMYYRLVDWLEDNREKLDHRINGTMAGQIAEALDGRGTGPARGRGEFSGMFWPIAIGLTGLTAGWLAYGPLPPVYAAGGIRRPTSHLGLTVAIILTAALGAMYLLHWLSDFCLRWSPPPITRNIAIQVLENVFVIPEELGWFQIVMNQYMHFRNPDLNQLFNKWLENPAQLSMVVVLKSPPPSFLRTTVGRYLSTAQNDIPHGKWFRQNRSELGRQLPVLIRRGNILIDHLFAETVDRDRLRYAVAKAALQSALITLAARKTSAMRSDFNALLKTTDGAQVIAKHLPHQTEYLGLPWMWSMFIAEGLFPSDLYAIANDGKIYFRDGISDRTLREKTALRDLLVTTYPFLNDMTLPALQEANRVVNEWEKLRYRGDGPQTTAAPTPSGPKPGSSGSA